MAIKNRQPAAGGSAMPTTESSHVVWAFATNKILFSGLMPVRNDRRLLRDNSMMEPFWSSMQT
jgi:hypothetical protein